MIKDVSDCYNFEALVVSSSTVELFLRMRNDSFMGVKGEWGAGQNFVPNGFGSFFPDSGDALADADVVDLHTGGARRSWRQPPWWPHP